MVEAIYILEISGDRVLGVLYEDGRVVTFDSCDTQIYGKRKYKIMFCDK